MEADDSEIQDAEDLYALVPSEFTAARNGLVRRLRSEKRRDEAAAVAALRRPSPAAWALNQVARQEPDLLEGALEAGRHLREATQAAVAGDATKLRTATAEDRAAGDKVVEDAMRRLGAAGTGARQVLAATLRAAVLDDEIAGQLRRGVLATDHAAEGFGFASGFELGGGESAAPRSEARSSATPTAEAESAEHAKKREESERREREKREREKRKHRKELQARVTELGKRAKELDGEAMRLESLASAARAEADEAEKELHTARSELEAAMEEA